MRKIAIFIASLGFIIILGTVMMAFDGYMTEDRKMALQDGLSTQLEQGAEGYEQRREDGCTRRCGFFASMSHMIVGARDGALLSLPFDPNVVLAPTPAGWTEVAYDLGLAERVVGRELWITAVHTPTDNRILRHIHDTAAMRTAGAVRIYTKDGAHIILTVVISKDGLRDAKESQQRIAEPVETPFVTLAGLPVLEHPQVSIDRLKQTETPVAYRHFTIDIDEQVAVKIVSLGAEAEDIHAILAGLDITTMVGDLPAPPAAYDPLAGIVIPAPAPEVAEAPAE